MDVRALGLGGGQPENNEVRYELYPVPGACPIDETLETQCHACVDALLPLLRQHTWQKGRFDLQSSIAEMPSWCKEKRRHRGTDPDSTGSPNPSRPFLWGRMNFSDNIDDEWFVVWLLLELTQTFPLAARVWDNDGEFLLIEAAYSLPKGLKPENAEHRVWLYGGKVHVIPLKFAPAAGAMLSLVEGLGLVENPDVKTEASAAVAHTLSGKLSIWPQQSQNQRQLTHVLLPSSAAELLEQAPQLLPFAVEAYHYRDLDDAKAAARRQRFPEGEQAVLAAAPLSRCLYAQLALQQQESLGASPCSSQPEQLGSKITAGLEMLLARAAPLDAAPAATQSFADADAKSYLTLTKALADAPEDVAATALQQTDRRRAAGKQVVEPALHPSMQAPLPAEDPLDWLDELGVRLEEELDSRQAEAAGDTGGAQPHAAGNTSGPGPNASTEQAGFDPDQLARRMRQFVAAGAGLEGAEVPEGAPGMDGTLPTLDVHAFLGELQAALGEDAAGPGAGPGPSDDDEGSSFYDGTSGDGDSDKRSGPPSPSRCWPAAPAEPVDTETDSDDEGFDEAYGEVLRHQLAAGARDNRGTEEVLGSIPGDQPPRHEDPLTAPDLDMNLVQSLLQSVESQGGGPGPGSNLAALLGVPLLSGDGSGQRRAGT